MTAMNMAASQLPDDPAVLKQLLLEAMPFLEAHFAQAISHATTKDQGNIRSVLFRGLRARRGFWLAALTSAAAFTLPHLGDGSGPLADLIVVIGILPLGVLFAGLMD